MQNDQAGGSFNKDALIRNAPPLIAAAAKAGVKTVYTRQTPFLWKDEAVTWIRRAMKDRKGRSSEQAQTAPSERQLSAGISWSRSNRRPKTSSSTSGGRACSSATSSKPSCTTVGATTVVMIGCTTDGGVEMTVRDGHNRGHLMVIVRDCVGTYTEEGHNAALKRIERFADVVESKELIEIWQR